ncbi:aminotransferase-like domain-containing protein [Naumannella huperziae]
MSIGANVLAGLLGGPPWTQPRYRDLADRIARLIADGRIAAGTRLPSERDLAAATDLSRTTIGAAYTTLTERDLLRPRRGAGHFVTERPAPTMSPLLPAAGPDADGRIGLTAAADAALPHVGAAYARALDRLPELTGGSGYFPDGLPELRAALAERYAARGLPTDPRQLLITTGALSALAIVARTLAGPRRALITESVGFGNTLHLLHDVARRSGGRVRSFDTSPAGWNLDSLAAALAETRPAAVFVIADFHNPTGRQMDDATRAGLAARARRAGVPVVADETLAELPLPWAAPALPVAAHDPSAILVGSASKTYWGGLRLGWIRAPHAMIEPLLRARTLADHGAAVEQLVLAELLADPTATPAARERVHRQAVTALDLVREHLPEFAFRRPDGGQSLWLELPSASSTRLTRRAAEHGVLLTPGPHFFCNPGGERWLRLPFAAPEDAFAEAVRRIARAWQELDRPDAPTRHEGFGPLSA